MPQKVYFHLKIHKIFAKAKGRIFYQTIAAKRMGNRSSVAKNRHVRTFDFFTLAFLSAFVLV